MSFLRELFLDALPLPIRDEIRLDSGLLIDED
jgi:hypothetical protein